MKNQILAIIFIASLTSNFYVLGSNLGSTPASKRNNHDIDLTSCDKETLMSLRKKASDNLRIPKLTQRNRSELTLLRLNRIRYIDQLLAKNFGATPTIHEEKDKEQ